MQIPIRIRFRLRRRIKLCPPAILSRRRGGATTRHRQANKVGGKIGSGEHREYRCPRFHNVRFPDCYRPWEVLRPRKYIFAVSTYATHLSKGLHSRTLCYVRARRDEISDVAFASKAARIFTQPVEFIYSSRIE